ncbi:MAG: hypothetical protein IPI30_21820 [Saprospiraceae bacterium]|nr:hypothetical protein [Candidatus Vicinibacter affinis]
MTLHWTDLLIIGSVLPTSTSTNVDGAFVEYQRFVQPEQLPFTVEIQMPNGAACKGACTNLEALATVIQAGLPLPVDTRWPNQSEHTGLRYRTDQIYGHRYRQFLRRYGYRGFLIHSSGCPKY